MEEIRICPKCGSIKIKPDYRKGLTFIAGIQTNFSCEDCNFISTLFPVIDLDKIKDFRKELKKKDL